MKTRFLNIIAIVAILLPSISCNKLTNDATGGELVVEGWIESDNFPVILLSRTIPATSEPISLYDLDQFNVKHAKVSISDGTNTVNLVGKRDNHFYPNYIYTTSEMKGEVGKEYTIRIEAGGDVATARTTIPAPVPLTSTQVVRQGSHYGINATFDNDASAGLYYRCFVRVVGKDSFWAPSLLGVFDGSEKESEVLFGVNRGVRLPETEAEFYYDEGDVVDIRFCTMGRDMYDYWMGYETMQNISKNPMVPMSDNLPSNVEGAHGYWAGYGRYDTEVVVMP